MRIREAIKLRYKLGPYLYHILQTKGMYISPVLWQATDLTNSWDEYVDFSKDQNEFMLGPSLLVCPIWINHQSKQAVLYQRDYGVRHLVMKRQKLGTEIDDDIGVSIFQKQRKIVPIAFEAASSIEDVQLKPLALR